MRKAISALPIALTGVTAALACGGADLTLPSASRPGAIAVVRGNNQTASAGQALPDSLVVRVIDPENRPVPQLRVAFVVMAGGGTAAPDTAVTDNDGRAASRWTLGTTAGTQTVEARVAGSDAVKATFTGTAAGGGGPTLTETHITSASPDPSFPTQPVTVGFTVTSILGPPAGKVRVSDGTVSCTASVAGGQCSLAPPTAGPTTLTATYEGSATFAPSSGTAQHEVILAGTSTSLSSSDNPSKRDESVTFTASVTSSFGTPSGSVVFVEGSCASPTRIWSMESLDDSGQADYSTKTLSAGTHLMLACYLGNNTFAPSTSDLLQQQVADQDD
jgi:hypothetical protein